MTQRFPFEKMWSFQSVEHQIAMELSYFNWYQIVQELQKAFNAFAALLQKILYDTSKDRIKINPEKVNKFLDLYFGNGKESDDTIERGLYALDIVQREFEERYAVLCRGYNEEISPASHHQMVMIFYKEMYPLVWELWHQIANQIESEMKVPIKWGEQKSSPVEKGLDDLRTKETTDYWLNQGRLQQRPIEKEDEAEIKPMAIFVEEDVEE